jgi:hypothetical protein
MADASRARVVGRLCRSQARVSGRGGGRRGASPTPCRLVNELGDVVHRLCSPDGERSGQVGWAPGHLGVDPNHAEVLEQERPDLVETMPGDDRDHDGRVLETGQLPEGGELLVHAADLVGLSGHRQRRQAHGEGVLVCAETCFPRADERYPSGGQQLVQLGGLLDARGFAEIDHKETPIGRLQGVWPAMAQGAAPRPAAGRSAGRQCPRSTEAMG